MSEIVIGHIVTTSSLNDMETNEWYLGTSCEDVREWIDKQKEATDNLNLFRHTSGYVLYAEDIEKMSMGDLESMPLGMVLKIVKTLLLK